MAFAVRNQGKTRQNVLQALEGEVTPRVPFWLMRQAGRYLPEYRDLRKKAGSFLDLCFTPDYAAEATLQPIRRFEPDAAILFSDILVIPYALGQTLDFVEGEGPRLGALEKREILSGLRFDEKKLQPVYETVSRVRAELPADKTLIGFAGAPWTVACYMIQGQGDGEFTAVRKFALEQEETFSLLIKSLVSVTTAYLIGQIRAGVDAVQIFDSWAGLLPEPQFKKWVADPTREIVAGVRAFYPDVPIIGFPRGAGALVVPYTMKTGINGLGLDTQASLGWAMRELGREVCLQGNLDPAALLAGGAALDAETRRILDTARAQPFIFNLGHGVIKDTPPEHVARLSALVRGFVR
jgi:uroporphyrinogen decarboxylase